MVIYDVDGVARIRLGNLEDGPMATEMYHITKDGKYIDGLLMDTGSHTVTNLSRIRNTYADCHAWCNASGTWYNTPVNSVGFARWEGCYVEAVPECVRMAELLK